MSPRDFLSNLIRLPATGSASPDSGEREPLRQCPLCHLDTYLAVRDVAASGGSRSQPDSTAAAFESGCCVVRRGGHRLCMARHRAYGDAAKEMCRLGAHRHLIRAASIMGSYQARRCTQASYTQTCLLFVGKLCTKLIYVSASRALSIRNRAMEGWGTAQSEQRVRTPRKSRRRLRAKQPEGSTHKGAHYALVEANDKCRGLSPSYPPCWGAAGEEGDAAIRVSEARIRTTPVFNRVTRSHWAPEGLRVCTTIPAS